MKLLVLLVVGYVCYRAIKNWIMAGGTTPETVTSDSVGEIDDVMIQDPVCGVYVPKGSSIRLQNRGEELFFCSQECKEKFLHTHKEL